VVRPVIGGREANYDIDLVCLLTTPGAGLTPSQLKNLIGDRLKSHGTYRSLLDAEGRRCWTLEYAEADGIGFHLDALPAIPEQEAARVRLVIAGVPGQYSDHAIAITERTESGTHHWLDGGTNPFGFAAWFDSLNVAARIRVAADQKRHLFEANRLIYASVEDVPDGLVRSPLQRAIQVLKRHRDVRFTGHQWESEAPISIIITTLAALAYNGESDVGAALNGILGSIDDYQSSGVIIKRDGRWVIPNPVNPGENFADRWNDPGSHRAEAFFEWIAWVQQDLALAQQTAWESDSKKLLAESLGLSSEGTPSRPSTGAKLALASDSVPSLANTSHCQPPPWPVQLQYGVKVTGGVRRSLNASKTLWRLAGRAVPKEYAIRFHAETNAPPPYEVKWQVVNTGPEAEKAGREQLRGGFDPGEGLYGNTRREGTAYRGTHGIEAFVVKDGRCVARSGRILVRVK